MMWMMHLLPDSFLIFIIHALLVVGLIGMVIGFVGSKIPFVGAYATIIKIVSIILFCTGVYWKGGYSVEADWRQRVAELEEKVKESEEKSRQTNVVIETKYRDRVKTVTETKERVVENIKEREKVINAKCELDPSVISILNEAAKKP
jgi:hypothetical protein